MRLPYEVDGPVTQSMITSDGVRLDADVYRPRGEGNFPVLLMRQPYGRKIAATVVYAHPSWYAAHGYIVVIQDVRGRGTSEGKYRLFVDDVRDGGEAVAWAAGLPGSTGKVGMYGFSYQGVTQLLALASGAPALATICPSMCGYDIHSDWAYEGGAFCFSGGLGWGLQMAAEQARIAGDEKAYIALLSASRNPPLNEARPYMPKVAEEFGSYAHYPDWVAHPTRDEYWQSFAPLDALAGKSINIPMLHIGGWYDGFLMGTLGFWKQAASRTSTLQKLVVGPWTHIPWGRIIGAVDMGAGAVSTIDERQIEWFDHILKNAAAPARPDVELFDLVTQEWRGFEAWPDTASPRFLASKGLSTTTASGSLGGEKTSDAVPDRIVHDPWRPAPSLGGHNAYPGGMQNRASLDDRTDVATFTSEPLEAPLALAGEVSVSLAVSADQPSYDISAILSRVTPAGQVFNLTQGYARIDGTPAGLVKVAMRATCATLQPGDALRLSLAAANYPAFGVNPGTGDAPLDTRLIDCRVTTLTVVSGGENGSFISLPVLAG